MSRERETCWTLIQAAGGGDREACRFFAETYAGVIRNYLGSRWQRGVHASRLEDAVQDVFLDCFRQGGALTRLQRGKGGSFRAFLFGIVRNVALRYEETAVREGRRRKGFNDWEKLPASQEKPSQAFDRAWAKALLQRAVARQKQWASQKGPEAIRRLNLLQLRLTEGRPIREIAAMWQQDPARLHHAYAKARQEFKQALKAEIQFQFPSQSQEVDQECQWLLELFR
ncbi:MAG: sigma-70 family RNA polymerase sigma factor [Planctomycetota bacterium]|nr:MAG: sigma-70 family RNA polymerase sigma factor [Planctomycetota bacterium]